MKLRQVSIKDYKKIKNLFKRNKLEMINFNRWKNLWNKNPILKKRRNWIKGWVMIDGSRIVGHFGSFPTKYYLNNNSSILGKNYLKHKSNDNEPSDEVTKKIINILDEKVRPAVAKDGGDIKFKSFENGLVTVELQGSCSGCPSSIMTLKQGVQNLLCHYVPEVKRVEAI